MRALSGTDSARGAESLPHRDVEASEEDATLDQPDTTLFPSVPLVDLALQHTLVSETIEQGWAQVIETSSFVLGGDVGRFERAFASFCGVRHCIGTASGTDALELSLRALGVGQGDEVIVPTNSFIASASAVVRAGGIPVLVDVDPACLLIDPEQVAARRTRRTAAVIAVHLFGQMAPVEEVRRSVDDRVFLVEDAAQAHGATRHGVVAGGFGEAAATSFYPGKNLGAYGDAGGVLTGDDEVATKVRALRDHGSRVKYHHPEIGFNSRLDTLQAVVLNAKLPHLDSWNQARREAAERYDKLLGDIQSVVRPQVLDGNEHVWHLYVVRVPRRDEVLSGLRAAGVGAAVHYPTPIHLQGAFRHLGCREGDFPVAEAASREILSLPIYPGITPEQQDRVINELRRILG